MSEVKRYDLVGDIDGNCNLNEARMQLSGDGVYVMHCDYEALQAKCAELAAENAKLADCANFYRLGFRPVKCAFGIEWKPTEQLLDDCGNTAIEAIKTQATEAFLDEVRAAAVDEVCLKISNAIINCYQDEMVGLDEAATICGKFAAHLRKGGEQK